MDDEMEAELAAAVRTDVQPLPNPACNPSCAFDSAISCEPNPNSDPEMLHLCCYMCESAALMIQLGESHRSSLGPAPQDEMYCSLL